MKINSWVFYLQFTAEPHNATMSMKSAAYVAKVRYDEKAAHTYERYDERKHRAEIHLIDRALALLPQPGTMLDLPCGTGRLVPHLTAHGMQLTCADFSESMRQLARERILLTGLPVPVEAQDIESLTFPDGSFDYAISFRMFHHFPNPQTRERAIHELCRVTRRDVLLSYFSPWSVTSCMRRFRAWRGGRVSHKISTPLREVKSYFARQGFRLVKDFARTPLIHTLHLAVFERVTPILNSTPAQTATSIPTRPMSLPAVPRSEPVLHRD